MDINKFIIRSPYLYHLTSSLNVPNIIKQRKLFSTNYLIGLTNDKEVEKVKYQKRFEHLLIKVNGNEVSLRDQRPISLLALSKCLTNDWKPEDFIFHLNDRVFLWPNLDRLKRHFNRYVQEKPVILRFKSADVFASNTHAKFSRLNSGATRANSYLGGKAPARGSKTFLPADQYNHPVRSVAEVTFEKQCFLPSNVCRSSCPDGPYRIFS